jgi:hypothetical protein
MSDRPDRLMQLAAMLANTRDDEVDCEQVFQIVDVYAEAAARGDDVAHVFPLIQHHLALCRDCLEEYQALENVLQAESP